MIKYTITIMHRFNGHVQHFQSRELNLEEFAKSYGIMRRRGIMYDYKAEWEREFYVTEFKGRKKRIIRDSLEILRMLNANGYTGL